MSTIRITLSHETVGSVLFLQPQGGLAAERTASGFRLQIPAALTLTPPSGSGSPLLLENLHVTFSAQVDGKPVEIGTANGSSFFTTPADDIPVTFAWDWTFEAFGYYEKIRAGREPKFRLHISGDVRFILVPPGSARTGREACSLPFRFHEWGEVGYSQATWTTMMRNLNLQDVVLLEIPVPADPPNGWEPVWNALRDARDSFDQGGSTGWKSTVTGVRLALEAWQDLEKEDHGPGWQRPSRNDLESRTKAQRTDAIRWHLIQIAHFAAHTKAEEWTRDDALLMLSTISALLAVRKP